jgi:hypothetical protein
MFHGLFFCDEGEIGQSEAAVVGDSGPLIETFIAIIGMMPIRAEGSS